MAVPSYTSALLEESLSVKESEVAKWSAVSLYAGGADTVGAYLFAPRVILYAPWFDV